MAAEQQEKEKKDAPTGHYRRRNAPADDNTEKMSRDNAGDIHNGLWKWLTDLLSFPVRLLIKYFRRELTSALRHDLKIYMLMAGIAGMMFIFVVILWLTLSIAVGVFFYEKGFTLLQSVLFSLAFQFVVILLSLLTAHIACRRRRTARLLKELREITREEK